MGRMRVQRAGRAVGTAVAIAVAGAIGASGCVHHHHHAAATPSVQSHRHGPPPHAPAHGYRHKAHREGLELEFDAGLGVYLVVGWPGVYWHADRYLRWYDGHWSASARIDGGWVVVASRQIPSKLAAKHARRAKRPKRSKHGPPAKHAH